MVINRAIGYVLLILGLALIGWTVWQSYNIFIAKAEAPLVFKTSGAQQASKNNGGTLEQQLQAQMEQTIQKQLNQILPAATITKILNLLSWSVFSGILIFGGSAIAGIGVKLIK